MNNSIHRISLDIHDTGSQVSISAKKGDTARSLYIILTENGKPYRIADGCYAVLTGIKPDKNYLYNDCAVKDNVIIYDFTEQTVPVVGQVLCEITLYDANNERITSPRFDIVVDDVVYNDEEIVSSKEATALITATAEAKAITAEVEQKLANGDFVGEKGEKGDKGDQGIQGERGEKGEKGEDADPQLYANAVIGNAIGEIVRVDDVSPVEHTTTCKIKSKNIFNNTDDFYPAADATYTYNGNILTINGYYASKFIQLEDEKTYTLSFQSTRTGSYGGGVYIACWSSNDSKQLYSAASNRSATATFTIPKGFNRVQFTFYGSNSTEAASATYTELMLEEGTEATGYIPYTDASAATVTRYGKNLLDLSRATFSGATYNEAANGITCKINNGYYSSARVDYLNDFLLANKGKNITFSIADAIEGAMITMLIYGTRTSGRTNQEGSSTGKRKISFAISEEFTEITGFEVRANRFTSAFVDTTTVIRNMQVEVGDVATDFEEYKESATYTPNADGTVEGITSLSPTMTLLTDTEGVTVECEYIRDTKKYVDLALRPTDEQVQAAVDAYLEENPVKPPVDVVYLTDQTTGTKYKLYVNNGRLTLGGA